MGGLEQQPVGARRRGAEVRAGLRGPDHHADHSGHLALALVRLEARQHLDAADVTARQREQQVAVVAGGDGSLAVAQRGRNAALGFLKCLGLGPALQRQGLEHSQIDRAKAQNAASAATGHEDLAKVVDIAAMLDEFEHLVDGLIEVATGPADGAASPEPAAVELPQPAEQVLAPSTEAAAAALPADFDQVPTVSGVVSRLDPEQPVEPAEAEVHEPAFTHASAPSVEMTGAIASAQRVFVEQVEARQVEGAALAPAEMVVALSEQKQALKTQANTQEERATIEVVALLFASILTEERIPTAVRVWFARLQMPVLRVALAGFANGWSTLETRVTVGNRFCGEVEIVRAGFHRDG